MFVSSWGTAVMSYSVGVYHRCYHIINAQWTFSELNSLLDILHESNSSSCGLSYHCLPFQIHCHFIILISTRTMTITFWLGFLSPLSLFSFQSFLPSFYVLQIISILLKLIQNQLQVHQHVLQTDQNFFSFSQIICTLEIREEYYCMPFQSHRRELWKSLLWGYLMRGRNTKFAWLTL